MPPAASSGTGDPTVHRGPDHDAPQPHNTALQKVEVRLPPSLADLAKDPPPDREWLVEGLLARGGAMVIGGPRALGKSWFALQLAEALLTGAPFLDQFPCTSEGLRVLILSYELTDGDLLVRWRKLTIGAAPPDRLYIDDTRRLLAQVESVRANYDAGRGPHQDITDGARSYSVRRSTAALVPTASDGRSELEHIVRELKIDVVIFEPWASFYTGDENSNTDIQHALNQLDQLRNATGCAVIAVTHFAKHSGRNSGLDPSDLWRGGTRLADWADARLTLTPRDLKRSGLPTHGQRQWANLAILTRLSEPIDDLILEADPDTRRWASRETDPSGHTADSRQSIAARKADRMLDVARAVHDAGGYASTKAASVALQHLGSENTIRESLQAAERAGYVRSVPNGRGTKWLPAGLRP